MDLETKWDKVFPKSKNVHHEKITFKNIYGITLVADLYKPIDIKEKLPAIAISGPFGAVKEQSSGLYAQILAENGFLTIAFDPSYTGESGGEPRHIASPDINTEDFQAAIDYLFNNDDVDSNRIGILGICGWGGIALNATCYDTRIKATVTSTMYNMSRVAAKGYFDEADNPDMRYNTKVAVNNQRSLEFGKDEHAPAGGVVDPLPDDAPFFIKDYHDYYKTERGYHKRSLNSNDGWAVIGALSYMNQPILSYTSEIRSAVLMIHGEKAHSCYMSKDEFEKLTGDNKELLIIPDAVHTDLYDNLKFIPFDKIISFYNEYL